MIENVSEVAFGIYAVGNCKLSDVVCCNETFIIGGVESIGGVKL